MPCPRSLQRHFWRFSFLILNFFKRIILAVNHWESKDLTVTPASRAYIERGGNPFLKSHGCERWLYTFSSWVCESGGSRLTCRRRFHVVTWGGFFLWFPKAPGVFKQRPPISIAPSSPLLPLHEEVEALLFLSEGKPYLLEVCPCSTKAIFLLSVFLFLRKKMPFVISCILYVTLM